MYMKPTNKSIVLTISLLRTVSVLGSWTSTSTSSGITHRFGNHNRGRSRRAFANSRPLLIPFIASSALDNGNLFGSDGKNYNTLQRRRNTFLTMSKESATGHELSSVEKYTVCSKCHGEGKIRRPPSKKARLRHKRAKMNNDDLPTHAPARLESCSSCQGTGIVVDSNNNNVDADKTTTSLSSPEVPPTKNDFKVAIVGGGLGGLALAIACRHRSISCRVFERDSSFNERSQGYGLTMQQASKALKSFGVQELKGGITSTKHIVHKPDGEEIGEWGLRTWGNDKKSSPKRQNVHIARQALRYQLLEALGGSNAVEWNCQLHDLVQHDRDGKMELVFKNKAKEKERGTTSQHGHDQNNDYASESFRIKADVVVGADGIRSTVRQFLIGDDVSPLRYLGCLVMLGICPASDISPNSSVLLDGETVFQTADGITRIYVMPYSEKEYMWQLSFPVEKEDDAKALSSAGPEALKDEALKRCQTWHDPIPQLLQATPVSLVSGYPVYDRSLLEPEMILKSKPGKESTKIVPITLLGDAAHPMSPFKGQGANQALLDALSLARSLYKTSVSSTNPPSSDNIRTPDLIHEALRSYEEEMIIRSAVKVKASAEAANFLHTDVAIQPGNVTRGAAAAVAAEKRSIDKKNSNA